MSDSQPPPPPHARPLGEAARLDALKILNPSALSLYGGVRGNDRVLVVLAA